MNGETATDSGDEPGGFHCHFGTGNAAGGFRMANCTAHKSCYLYRAEWNGL